MPGGDYRQVLAQLKIDLPRQVARDALRELKQAADDTRDDAQARILRADARKYPDRGLRAEIAATVRSRTRVTARDAVVIVESSDRLMPPGKKNLPAYADGTDKAFTRWRHPVFGPTHENPDPKWVTQEWPSAYDWFYGAWNRDRMIRAAEQGMQRAADDTGRP